MNTTFWPAEPTAMTVSPDPTVAEFIDVSEVLPRRLRSLGQPSARAAGDQVGYGGGRQLTAARLHRGLIPRGTAVGGHEELLADDVSAGLRAGRDNFVAYGHDSVDVPGDARRLLGGVDRAAGGRRHRRLE
jgi:hypothetical protein